jgi:hypothetical protein
MPPGRRRVASASIGMQAARITRRAPRKPVLPDTRH